MLVNILVQSDLSAPANGYLQVTIDSSHPVGDLVTKFCEDKQIEESSQYCLINAHNHVLDGKKPISHYGIQSGDKVIFCTVSEKPNQFQSWGLIAIIAVIISIIGFGICVGIHLGLVTVPDSYALVLDAGSTHTQVILYRWPGNKVNNTGLVVQENSCGIKGGIGELHSPSDVPAYLGPCLRQLKADVPVASLDHTEIFFGATAGMRVLKEMNETLAEGILAETRKTLGGTGLKFHDDKKAGILTGSVEGACGWLTVNYLNNNLGSRSPTWGALDLGGASTQISFELNHTQALATQMQNESLVASFHVYGRKVEVFSKSFLCYGLVQSTIRYRAHLILNQQTPNGARITSPCEPAGYSIVAEGNVIFTSPCSPRTKDDKTANENYTFAGSSNWAECQSTMRFILSEEFCQLYGLKDCISIDEIPFGFQNNHYMGFSAFGYIDASMRLGVNATYDDYQVEVKDTCTQTLNQLYKKYVEDPNPPKPAPRDINTVCFGRLYMFTLLSDVYLFNTNEKWSNLRFGIKIREKDLGWALGFMVNETQSIAAAPWRYGMDTIVFVLLVIFFAIFFLVSTGFVMHALKSRNSLNRTYSNLGLAA